MKRSAVARALDHGLAEDTVVFASLGTAGRAWREQGASQLTYYASDPMGTAPALALGAAVSRPNLEFVLLEGDGDLAMNLGVLLTIANTAPPNLHIVVFDNGRYETGGGQPLGTHATADLAAIGRGAGLASVDLLPATTTEGQLRAFFAEFLSRPGPALAVIGVEPEPSPYGGPGQHSGVQCRTLFQEALAARGADVSTAGATGVIPDR